MTFDELHSRYFKDLRAFVQRRVRDPDVADDIAQETFFRAYRSRRSYDPERPAWPWLITIARNLIRNKLRDDQRLRRHVVSGLEWDELKATPDLSAEADSENRLSTDQRNQAIKAALAALPPRQRRVFLLRISAGLSYHEIASLEGVTIDASKSLVKRARKRFKQAYGSAREDGGVPVWIPPIGIGAARRLIERGRYLGRSMSAAASTFVPLVDQSGQMAVATAAVALIALTPTIEKAAATPAPPVVRVSSTRPASEETVRGPVAGAPSGEDDIATTEEHGPVSVAVGGLDRPPDGEHGIRLSLDSPADDDAKEDIGFSFRCGFLARRVCDEIGPTATAEVHRRR